MRLRERFESVWSGTTRVTNASTFYVYDGNLVIQERNASNLPLVTYTRGPDLSGRLERAGGIGGLLARSDNTVLATQPPAAYAFYQADANGNITCLINSQQAIVARYLYDPYGRLLSQSGPLAAGNLYRFSSKEFHVNSGTYYYLYRFYDPGLQRWLNRDPIEELGGLNLFAFLFNRPLDLVDFFGLADRPVVPPGPPTIYWPPKVGGNCNSEERAKCEAACAAVGKVLKKCHSGFNLVLKYRRVFDLGNGWRVESYYAEYPYLDCSCVDPRTQPPPPVPCLRQNAPPPLPPHSQN